MAGIIYVDATPANTTLAHGAALVEGIDYTASNAADGAWNYRSFGNGTTVFTSNDAGSEDAPRLRTTAQGLASGHRYRVYAYFWGAHNALWRGRASLLNTPTVPGYNSNHFSESSFAAMTFISRPISGNNGFNPGPITRANDAGFESGGLFANAVLTQEADRSLCQVDLGIIQADTKGTLSVYIDDLENTDQGNRTWYDGIGYKRVFPIVYLDASPSNTTLADGSPLTPDTLNNSSDNAWGLRPFGNAATVYTAGDSATEDAPIVRTTITGLSPGNTYEVFVYFWTSEGIQWDVNVGLTPTPRQLAEPSNSVNVNAEPMGRFADAITMLATEADRTLYEHSVGVVVADAKGEASVYVDDTANDNRRSWLDGVGYRRILMNLGESSDADGDGVTNADEISGKSHPFKADSDGDGIWDGQEIVGGSSSIDSASTPQRGDTRVAVADGVWTWFNDERGLWHKGSLYLGYVRSDGEYGVTHYNPITNASTETLITTAASRERDDHNNPSFTVLPDDRLLITYARHIRDKTFFYRFSNNDSPTGPGAWGSELSKTVDTDVNLTYAHTFRLSAENNRLYHFYRAINWDPTFSISDDLGETWSQATHFIDAGGSSTRPYTRYTSNGRDRIDVIYTDAHPRNGTTSVYHMYYKDGGLRDSGGVKIKSMSEILNGDPIDHDGDQNNNPSATPERGTPIYSYSTEPLSEGQTQNDHLPFGRAWVWDIEYATDGNPVVVFQVGVRDAAGITGFIDDRIYYYYARYDGARWKKKLIAQGGRPIYAAERDYGGGITIDPNNPNRIYMASNAADPANLAIDSATALAPDQRYQLWRGEVADNLTVTWTQLTFDSSKDNIRPFVPAGLTGRDQVVWLAGRYSSYVDFTMSVMVRLWE